ncbi:MAG: cadherin repeat domain-containing protein [Alphaproteobacteria bacterium]
MSNSASLNDANNYVSVATFTPIDVDGDGFEYDITGVDASFFTIDGDGILKLKYQLDYESTSHPDGNYSIIISARGTAGGAGVDDGAGADDGTLWISQAFVLSVANTNDNITEWSGTQPSLVVVDEDITTGAKSPIAIATFTAIDADGNEFGYDVNNNSFFLDSDGVLYVRVGYDYESLGMYNASFPVDVHARGASGGGVVGNAQTGIFLHGDFGWIRSRIVFSIVNINDNATEWSGTPPNMVMVDETAGVGSPTALIVDNYQSVATFIPTDADGDGFEYDIGGADSGLFIIGSDGILKLTYQLDREQAGYADGNYSIIVMARGTAGGTGVADGAIWISQAFVISIANINDNITEWSGAQPSLAAVSEAYLGDSVAADIPLATFTPTDADGTNFEYEVDDGFSGLIFGIDSNGVLSTKLQFDYENNTRHWTATVWVRGTSGGAITSDAMGGDTQIRSGLGGGWISHVFVMSIANIDEPLVNDTATEWSGNQPTDFIIDETAGVSDMSDPANYLVATFTPIDADGDGFEYRITGQDANFFNIFSNGVVLLKYQLDYESTSHPDGNYSIIVEARGTAGVGNAAGDGLLWVTQVFVLSVANINDTASEWSGSQPSDFTISETAGLSGNVELSETEYLSLATFTPTDIDGDDGFIFFLSGDAANFFIIGASDGILKLKYQLDREAIGYADGNYSIIISARGTDGGLGVADGTLWITQAFVLSVENLNDIATEWSGVQTSSLEMKECHGTTENQAWAVDDYKALATFTTLDGDGVEYGLSGSDAMFFTIDEDGVLLLKYGLDYESTNHPDDNYSIIISARGTGGGVGIGAGAISFVTQAFVLSITDIDEGNIDDNVRSSEWLEPPPSLAVVDEVFQKGLATALDPDEYIQMATFMPFDADGKNFEYEVDDGFGGLVFGIDSDGVLFTKYQFDYEGGNLSPNNWTATIWARGTSGGALTSGAMGGDTQSRVDGSGNSLGGGWISHVFVMSIGNLDEYGKNDAPTEWSGSQPNMAVVDETVGVSDMVALTTPNYVSLATFTPMDEEGTNFEYRITGQDANLFTIGSDGILLLKYQFDYESLPNNYSIVVEARGTDGGSFPLGGVFLGEIWVTQAFVLSVKDVNDGSTQQSTDLPISLSDVEYDGDDIIDSAIVNFDNLRYYQNDTDLYITVSDLDGLELSFSDGDYHHWYFIEDDANDGTGHIMFDFDGDVATNGDQINLFGDSNDEADGDFDSSGLTSNNNGALTFEEFLDLIGGEQNVNFV